MQKTDVEIAQGIERNKREAFELLFNTYYRKLCVHSFTIVKDMDVAEEIVQDLMLRVCEKGVNIDSPDMLKFYLYKSVTNNSYGYLKFQKRFADNEKDHLGDIESDFSIDEKIGESELLCAAKKAIDKLPPKTGEIFRMSREQGLTYKEIAGKADISVKTVEYHMNIAISTLRKKLRHYISLIILFFISF